MKGQINLEFLSSALLFLLAIGTVLVTASASVPDLSDIYSERALHLEANRISTQVISSPGNSSAEGINWTKGSLNDVTEFGLSSDRRFALKRQKVQNLTSFTYTGGSGLNYSSFKQLTNAREQYSFNFVWKPLIHLEEEVPVKNYTDQAGPGADLRAYWRMDERTDNLIDSSDGTNQLQATGSPVQVDGALDTRGLELESSEYLNSSSGYSFLEFSISAWFRPSNLDPSTGTQWIAGFGNPSSSFGIALEGTQIGILDRSSGAGFTPLEEVQPNSLVNVVATRNSTGYIELYMDGTRVGNIDSSATAVSGDAFAGDSPSSGEGFSGTVDEFRIYNTSLSRTKVQRISSGRDYYSKLAGEPVELPSSISSSQRARLGTMDIFGSRHWFVASATGNTFDTLHLSSGPDFTGSTAYSEGDNISIDTRTNLTAIDRNGRYAVLSQYVNQFGPTPNADDNVIRMERYASMEGEPIQMEVLAW